MFGLPMETSSMSKKSKPHRIAKPGNSTHFGFERLENRSVPSVLVVGTQAGDLTFAQAAAVTQNGDTIQVQAGTYTDFDVKWYASNLAIQAVGGPVILDDSGYSISNQKGIFDIIGNNASVQGITFESAHDFGSNGHNYAGIRDEGSGLTLDACTFLNNDDGLLVTPQNSGVGNVLVEYSVFSNNGYGDGFSHNMYINHVSSFTLEYSCSTDSNGGHDVKSRALNTYLLYNFMGESGSGANDQAALVDLPDGGNSYLIGNVIHKGLGAANGTMIDSNVEGYGDSTQENPTQLVELVNNTVVNDRSSGTDVLVFGAQTSPVDLINNLFAGQGEGGTALYSGQNGAPAAAATNESNLAAVNPGFVNAAGLNYQLTAGSAAIDAGVNSGTVNGFSLTPTNEYVAVANTEPRPIADPLDIGAYEFVPAGNQPPTVATPAATSAAFVTGTTVNISVLGADDGGEANLSYSWAAASGPPGVTFSASGSNAAKKSTVTFPQAGSYSFTATITDQGGLSVTSTTATVTVEQTPESLVLTPSTAMVIDGATEQFTATVTDQFGKAISHPTVTWMLSGVGSVSMTGLYTAPASGVGSATVTATSGAAVQTAAITIAKGSPKLTLAASASAAVFGQAVTFRATVSGPGASPAGTVAFYDDDKVLGMAPLNGSGTAELTTTRLTPSGHSISAVYSGDTSYIGASSGVSSVTVTRAATRIIVTPQEIFRKKKLFSVNLMAEIQSIAPGAGVPTGTVTFEVRKPKAKLLGTAALSDGSATLTVKRNREQNKVVTIIYSGDPDFLLSTQMTPRLTQASLKNLARPMVLQKTHRRQFVLDFRGRWS
jgi:hypothetical protein